MKTIKRVITKLIVAMGIAVAPLLGTVPVSAAADTCTWTGLGGDANWSTAGNWGDGGGPVAECDGAGIPEDGDTLEFPSGASQTTNTNDIAGLDLDNISITGNSYNLSGTAIDITPVSSLALQIGGSGTTFDIDMTINGSSSKAISANGNHTISGDIVLNLTGGGDMNIGQTNGANNLLISGIISGSTDGFIMSADAGHVTYNGNNTFTASGALQINHGSELGCGSDTCLGNSSNDLFMYGDTDFNANGVRSLPYNIRTEPTSGGTPVIIANDTLTLSGAIDVNTNTTIQEANGAFRTVTLNAGGVDVAGSTTLTFLSSGTYQDARFSVTGITGTGDVAVQGAELGMSGSTTFDGDIIVRSNGYFNSPSGTSSVGTATGGITIEDGGVLRNGISGVSVTIADAITVAGDGNTTGPYNRAAIYNEGDDINYSGTITLTGNTTVMTNQNSSFETAFSGRITGTGDLTFARETGTTSGHFTIEGTSVNDYSGQTNVEGTTLRLAKQSGGVAVPGLLNVNATATDGAFVFVANDGGDQIWDYSVVALNNNGAVVATFESSVDTEVVGTIVGNGHIESDGAGYGVTVGGNNTFGAFSGTFDNEGGTITKVGNDYWDISAASFIGGGTPFSFVISGTGHILWGSNFSNHPVSVPSGGVLKGTGSVGAVTVANGGGVNVGTSPGCMTMASLSLNSGSTYTQEIAGSTACSQYDQTTVTGTATLGSATLNIAVTTTPADGTVFTIITAGSVSGTFNGLANGATITANGVQFRVNYTATTVTLTKVSGTATVVTTPTLSNTGSPAIFSLVIGFMLMLVVAGLSRRKFMI